ncbi:MAG: Extracellular ligand-binding receptor, partial [Marmoricola sp.]|nr:Extracellular ligand-binding receptor [Marmoricola sp.]
ATGSIFASAGLTTITPSATNPMLATQHWATFHRVIDNDTSGGRLLATYIRTTLQGTKVAVVNDGGDYGKAFARSVQNPLGKRVVLTATVSESRTTFKTLIKHIRAKHAKVVVFGGYDPQAGLLAKQLVKAGYPGKIVTGDGAMDSGFARTAGAKAAARTFLAAGIAPPTLNASFTTAYHAAYGKAPAFYALESYDAARVFLAGIGQGAGTRAAVLDAVDHYDASGLTKKIAFTSHGELVHPTLWVYQPKGTGFVAKAHLR